MAAVPGMALSLSVVMTGARSAAAQIVTLDQVEAGAQRDRPELAERQASIARAQAELSAVRAKTGPTLAARAELGLSPGGRLVTVEDINGDPYLVQGSRSINQPGALVPQPRYAALFAGKLTLLDFGRTSLAVRASEAAIGAERASLLQAKIELVRAARDAYLAWVGAHQSWQLAERDAEVTTARTVSVRELISEGARPATDATLSAYDEQLSHLRQARARRAAMAALGQLGAAIQNALPDSSVPDLDVLEAAPAREALAASTSTRGVAAATSPTTTSPTAGPPSASQGDAAEDPTLTALSLQHQAALSAARAADRGAAPQLDASAELGIQGQDDEIFPMYRAGIALSVPIWDGGAQAAQADLHRAEARGLDARRELALRTLRAQRAAANTQWQAAGAELQLSLQLLATAETLLSQAEEHYRSGSDTLERVLSAQRSLVQARGEVLSAKLETARARLELTPIKVSER